jgi:hypothetical protein
VFASIRKYHGVEDADEASIRIHANGLSDVLRSLPGFRGYYALDCGGGVAITISLYETREAAEASNRLAAEWVKTELDSLLTGPPEIVVGEMTAVLLPQLLAPETM